MSVVFGHAVKIYKDSTIYKIPLFTSKSDISTMSYLGAYKNSTTYYSPLATSGTTEYSNKLRVYGSSTLITHNNQLRVNMYFTRSTYSPTSGITYYYFTVTKVTCEAPLPCAWTLYFKHGDSTYSVSMPANAKEKSGTLIETNACSSTSATWYPYLSYNNVSGTGNSYTVSTGSSDYSWLPLDNFN